MSQLSSSAPKTNLTSSVEGLHSNVLQGRRILIGLCGGIAAYKILSLIRLLKQQKAEVRVVMTEHAQTFVTPTSLQALSGEAVRMSLYDEHAELQMSHIELARWADLLLIAPASANMIGKIAHGLADDLLSTVVLATPAPLVLAPAMNQQMYAQPAVQHNIQLIKQRGGIFLGPESGEQACGDIGAGRLREPEDLLQNLCEHFAQIKSLQPNENSSPLHLRSVLITAGATKEPLDPVRFISNHSSGKMGVALALEALRLGADVHFVYGSVQSELLIGLSNHPRCHLYSTPSALEMYDAVMRLAPTQAIVVGCAAVADYRPAQFSEQKIKKNTEPHFHNDYLERDDEILQLTLVKNPDIISAVGHLREQRPFTVGFAAETERLAEYAEQKRQRKRLDLICANNVAQSTLGFNSDDNALHLYWAGGNANLGQASKKDLAQQVWLHILRLWLASAGSD